LCARLQDLAAHNFANRKQLAGIANVIRRSVADVNHGVAQKADVNKRSKARDVRHDTFDDLPFLK
jgi:hypothetical protein